MRVWGDEAQTFAWFTGLFEGDGSLNTRSGRTYIGIDLTDEDIVKNLQLRFGGKVYGPLPKKNSHNGWNVKPMWQWRLHTQKDVWPILDGMYPYLSQRRRERIDQARIAYKNRPVKGSRVSEPRVDTPVEKTEEVV